MVFGNNSNQVSGDSPPILGRAVALISQRPSDGSLRKRNHPPEGGTTNAFPAFGSGTIRLKAALRTLPRRNYATPLFIGYYHHDPVAHDRRRAIRGAAGGEKQRGGGRRKVRQPAPGGSGERAQSRKPRHARGLLARVERQGSARRAGRRRREASVGDLRLARGRRGKAG